MGSTCKKEYAESLVENYIKEIQNQQYLVKKNLGDMDMVNVNIENEFEEIAQNMISTMQKLINEINDVEFY